MTSPCRLRLHRIPHLLFQFQTQRVNLPEPEELRYTLSPRASWHVLMDGGFALSLHPLLRRPVAEDGVDALDELPRGAPALGAATMRAGAKPVNPARAQRG